MPKYQCLKCNYNTDSKMSMYKHFSRISKCSRSTDSIIYDDEEIIKYSLIPISEHNKLLKNKNKNYCVHKTIDEYIQELKDIYNTARKTCNYCNKTFQKYKELEYHLLDCVCINKNLLNNKNVTIDNSVNTTNNINTTNNTNNINNNINNTNIYNNINIHLHLPDKSLVSFNDNWNIDHLDKNTKTLLFMSTVKYTKTLEYLKKITKK